MKVFYISLFLMLFQINLIEPDRIEFSTIPNPVQIKKFLSEHNFETKEVKEEELRFEFFFAHGFSSCWSHCWRHCSKRDTVYSSSHLSSDKDIYYGPENIDDLDLRTAWIEGKQGYGVGESLTISLSTFDLKEIRLNRIVIVNGYTKSIKTWRNNSRVKRLKVYSNSKLVGILCLKDTDKYQSFNIGNLIKKADNKYVLEFEIVDVYPGDKYKDTAISAILFEGEGCG